MLGRYPICPSETAQRISMTFLEWGVETTIKVVVPTSVRFSCANVCTFNEIQGQICPVLVQCDACAV
jgi:hypothetical protein